MELYVSNLSTSWSAATNYSKMIYSSSLLNIGNAPDTLQLSDMLVVCTDTAVVFTQLSQVTFTNESTSAAHTQKTTP